VFHLVYQVTNLINGKFYVGYHKTANVNDSYLGSGTVLRRAVAKYGEENFRKEILFTFNNANDAFAKEEELVQQHQGNPQCYNLRKGGKGGFDFINRSGLKFRWGSGSANPHYGHRQTEKNRNAVAASNRRRRKHPVREVQHIGVAESNRHRSWTGESRDKLGRSQRKKTVSAATRKRMATARAAWWSKKLISRAP
jgi:group I intron endonuclease